MAAFTTSLCFKTFTFTILFLKTLAFDPIPLFSLADSAKDPKFQSNVVALFGNSKFVNGDGSEIIHLYGSGSSATGRVMYKKSIKLVEGKPKQLVSFSTYFAFSISLDNGSGLAFVMVPNHSQSDVLNNTTISSGFPFGLKNRISKGVGVEFSASRDARNGVSTFSNVAINVGNSVAAKISKSSSINLALRNGEKLHAWIDYEASSMRLEVRLSQHVNSRPSNPLLWHSLDLSYVLKDKEMFVGFSPVKGNPTQACFIYSWSFALRHFPHSMHSETLDPKVLAKNTKTSMIKQRNDCFLGVLAAMIFGTGCGALAAFVVLYLWTIFGNKRPVVPEEIVMQPLDVEYRKVKIVVDKTMEDSK